MQQEMWPVDVIFLCGADGEILPLRVRSKEGFEETLVGNVSAILCRRNGSRIGTEYHAFLCRIQAGKTAIVMELKFFVQSHSWYMSLPGVSF